jgi:hypothetical protein
MILALTIVAASIFSFIKRGNFALCLFITCSEFPVFTQGPFYPKLPVTDFRNDSVVDITGGFLDISPTKNTNAHCQLRLTRQKTLLLFAMQCIAVCFRTLIG